MVKWFSNKLIEILIDWVLKIIGRTSKKLIDSIETNMYRIFNNP